MPAHENKVCPRCTKQFECKVGGIAQCDCRFVNLTTEEQAFIESKYEDCLCVDCLKHLKNKYILFKEKYLH